MLEIFHHVIIPWEILKLNIILSVRSPSSLICKQEVGRGGSTFSPCLPLLENKKIFI